MNLLNAKRYSIAAAALLVSLALAGCGNGGSDAQGGHNGHSGHQADNGAAEEADNAHGGHGEASGETTETQLSWSFTPEQPKPGEQTTVEIEVRDAAGQPIEKFDVNHEKLMHLIVVSEDLAFFDHLHPEYQGEGKFAAKADFPEGGEYKLFADFIPSGMEQLTLSTTIEAAGDHGHAAALQPDLDQAKTAGGNEAKLAVSTLKAGEEAMLTFSFTDEKTKESVTDLQPYLGAIGHVVIVSEDLSEYLHVHPADEAGSGPEASFHTTFPRAGVYKLWGQFQRDNETFIIPYTIRVTE